MFPVHNKNRCLARSQRKKNGTFGDSPSRLEASDLPSTPLPFLNRFEKFYLGPAEWALHQAHQLCLGNINHQLLNEYLLEPARRRLEVTENWGIERGIDTVDGCQLLH